MGVGSGSNLTQVLTSQVGRDVSLPPSCQAQRRQQSKASFSGERGGSGHSPSWAQEFSQVDGARMECMLIDLLIFFEGSKERMKLLLICFWLLDPKRFFEYNAGMKLGHMEPWFPPRLLQ